MSAPEAVRSASSPSLHIAVVAAFEPEIIALRDGAMLAHEQVRLTICPVGVGLVESALGTAALLASHRPDLVVFCGTCGALPGSSLEVGDVVVSSQAKLVDSGSPLGVSALPEIVPAVWSAPTLQQAPAYALRDALLASGAKPAVVATTLGITIDDHLARSLRETSSADAEHLEAFAVMRACDRASVASLLVLGVANPVGSSGRATWLASHRRVSAHTNALLARALGTLRAG
ncbi:MAG: hypothetical protein U0165_09875 [Polyangiaceae bacterium]